MPPISAAVLPECRFCYPCPHLGGVASLASYPTVIAKSYPIRTVIQLSRFIEGFYPPQGVAGGVRGEYPTSKNVFNLFLSLTNWRIFLEFGKKLFDAPTFNCLLPLENGVYQAFVPSLIPTRVGVCAPFFQNIFLLKTRKPPKSLINRAFSAVKIFLKFFLFDCKKA